MFFLCRDNWYAKVLSALFIWVRDFQLTLVHTHSKFSDSYIGDVLAREKSKLSKRVRLNRNWRWVVLVKWSLLNVFIINVSFIKGESFSLIKSLYDCNYMKFNEFTHDRWPHRRRSFDRTTSKSSCLYILYFSINARTTIKNKSLILKNNTLSGFYELVASMQEILRFW